MASNNSDDKQPKSVLTRKGSSNGRLPSIRPPRDLTLGGIKKKSFAPNIPQRKERTKEEPKSESPREPKDKKRNRRSEDGHGKGRGRGRGRGRGQTDFVQSHSIFEQGPAESIPKGGISRNELYEKREPRESISSVRVKKEDTEATNKIIDNLLRDDFIDRSDSDSDDDVMVLPVKLPLSLCKTKIEVKDEKINLTSLKLRDEPMCIVDESVNSKKNLKTEDAKSSIAESKKYIKDISASEVFQNGGKSETGEMLFFHLPNILPGSPSSGTIEKQPIKTEKGLPIKTIKTEPTKVAVQDNKSIGSSLSDFPEGHLGKIQILKSGRTRLVLKNISLDIGTGTPCGFLQDLAAVNINEETQTGDISILGHMTHKMVATPDLQHLLSQFMDTK